MAGKRNRKVDLRTEEYESPSREIADVSSKQIDTGSEAPEDGVAQLAGASVAGMAEIVSQGPESAAAVTAASCVGASDAASFEEVAQSKAESAPGTAETVSPPQLVAARSQELPWLSICPSTPMFSPSRSAPEKQPKK